MISPGAKLYASGDEDGCLGTIGPVLKDSRGNLLVLTSREFMERAKDVYADVAGVHAKVGERRDDFFPQGDREDAAVRLAAWFHPDAAMQIIEPPSGQRPQTIASEDDLLLEEASIFGAGSEPTGYVSRVNWFAKSAADGTSAATMLTGLIRISPLDAGAPFARPGLSGALVTTKSGALVGIVVGALDGDAVVVPLARILQSEDLALASAADIAKHNHAATALRRVPRATTEKGNLDLLAVLEEAPMTTAESGIADWRTVREPVFLPVRDADFDHFITHASACGETLGFGSDVYRIIVAKFIAAQSSEERFGIASSVSDYIIGVNRTLHLEDDDGWSGDRPRSGHGSVVRLKHANAA